MQGSKEMPLGGPDLGKTYIVYGCKGQRYGERTRHQGRLSL